MTDRADRQDQDRKTLKEAANLEKKNADRESAALREQPEDRRASARQTTAAGKARSK